MPKNPESNAQPQNVDVTEESLPVDKDSVSVERQLEVSRKYGVSEELISTMLNESASSEEKNEAHNKIVLILANAIIQALVDPDDVEDVSALVGPRWSASKEGYYPLWSIKQMEKLVS